MDRSSESVKLRSAKAADQLRRRTDTLARQKQRRAALMLSARLEAGEPLPQAEEDSPAGLMSTDVAAADPALPAELGETEEMDADGTNAGSARRRRSRAPNVAATALVAAEWMVDVPVDLPTNWYVMARPAGRRCLVSTAGGVTRAQGRSGKARSFPSALPGGSRAGGRAGECQLDCIFSEAEQRYYVVDLLLWKGQAMVDCTAEFRLFWLQARLSEARASVSSSSNPCTFVPLDPHLCTTESLRAAYTGAPFERDGLLFLHREGLYECGPSPLFLSWSDASCSSRFYDYGSAAMADALSREPEKAERWRTDEVTAAVGFDDIATVAAQAQASQMEDVGGSGGLVAVDSLPSSRSTAAAPCDVAQMSTE